MAMSEETHTLPSPICASLEAILLDSTHWVDIVQDNHDAVWKKLSDALPGPISDSVASTTAQLVQFISKDIQKGGDAEGVWLLSTVRHNGECKEWRLMRDEYTLPNDLPTCTQFLRPAVEWNGMGHCSFVFIIQSSSAATWKKAQQLKEIGTKYFQSAKYDAAVEAYGQVRLKKQRNGSHRIKFAHFILFQAASMVRRLTDAENGAETLVTACVGNVALCSLKLGQHNRVVIACNSCPATEKSQSRLGTCFEAVDYNRAAHYHLTQAAKLAPSTDTYAAVKRVAQKLTDTPQSS
jgi:hypothetical protein